MSLVEWSIDDVQRLEYNAVSFRYPAVLEAYQLGFSPGVREDYGFQVGDLPNVDLPCVFLDNDFRNPDLDRFLEVFERRDPSVAVLGDAYTRGEACELDRAACEVLEEHPYKEVVVVPKCREAFDVLDSDVVLGYPIGYSELDPNDFSQVSDWRGRKVHVMGGMPPSQFEGIQRLTQPTLSGDPPADVIGVDGNAVQKVSYFGEYWSPESGWCNADELSIRETVRESLKGVKRFWVEKGLWPETEPREIYGEAVERPDELIFMDEGGEPILENEGLESAYVEEYVEKGKLAFSCESRKKFMEYREDWTKVQ